MAVTTELADLLQRWALWCIAGNRAGLGYAMVGYAERIGTSWSTDNTPPPVDPDVLRVDSCIRRLPPDYRAVIVMHYLKPGVVATKLRRMNMTRAAYYSLLEHGRAFLRHALNHCTNDQ